MVEDPLLSVIVTAYNTERLNDIYELLDSLKVQTYCNIETLFIVERSQELLEKVLDHGLKKKIAALKVLFNSGESGLSSARNLGIKEARGDIIAFTDDDVVLYPDWAEHMVSAYMDDSIIGVTGPASPLWEDQSMSWFPEEFYWIISCTAWAAWDRPRDVRNAWGMNMSFRREAFEKAGLFQNEFGFHKGPMAEDNEFSLRVRSKTGKRIKYWPAARVRHRVHKYRLSWPFIRERAYWIGFSRRTVRERFTDRLHEESETLGQERRLIRRIFKRLFPSILAGFFTRPSDSWSKLKLTLFVLFFVASGYYYFLLPARWRVRVGGNGVKL
jgi:glycosyltransferase involved in cell wall biosynthesis